MDTSNTCGSNRHFLDRLREIHWRNIAFANDASSRALMLSGLFTLVAVACGLVFLAWVLQDLLFAGVGLATDVVKWPFHQALRRSPRYFGDSGYTAVNTNTDNDDDIEYLGKRRPNNTIISKSMLLTRRYRPLLRAALYFSVTCILLSQVVLIAIRPHESSLIFLSWTSALLPFIDFSSSSPNLDKLKPFFGNSVEHNWDNRTAVAHINPASLPWLSRETDLPGFSDWYNANKHYNASLDPLKISNLDSELLPGLQNTLKDIEVRNVLMIFLESTRKDVFPIKKHGLVWDKLANTFANGQLPADAEKLLESLTPNANFITGDYNDGLTHPAKPERRGGINFNNAYTTATYTLKSLTGTLCGISPLVADFNLEYNHHIYQPCLAQIFDALNHANASTGKEFTSYPWQSSFMQSVTLDFDKFDQLMLALGYKSENLIDKEYLKSSAAKFGKVDLPDVNYFGMVEAPLEDYIRDSFSSARKNNERVFLSHITSTSHHPFGMPVEETYVPVANGHGFEDLSHYINAIGYDDRWLRKILDILEEEGAANNTLVVLVGDHGLSMPENDMVSAYYNPNVGNLHVPLVFSHPQLPAIEVNDAVVASQILPTVLDILLETNSLNTDHKTAVRELLSNYEGQSLVRKQVSTSATGQGNWQFTIVNPGRAMLSVRDARQPALRLIVPIIDNIEWRFTNITADPKEEQPVLGFDFASFLQQIEKSHGRQTAEWAEEAAFVSRWWVEENSRRWRYGPYSE
ncbi:sulfatase domain-containing protein [Pochonia chlamydosporia 170]|uniref:Sulfatase domain-containing protein n=1 Tax=Pochonia chlamydosporia 170 TaxID=1380566 RepID=A0A179FWK7_METCM|nr:sulfatase domain-containing protein [Pochonia chlamydosporia 170]OAQ69618.2 sulfatase domain-containing protein [Pochonia chlamydosporia 170]